MITSKVLCTFHLLRVVPDCAAKDTSGIVLQIMRAAEYLSLMTIVGGFVALGSQTIHGEQMDGMSGINIDMCKSMQQLDD